MSVAADLDATLLVEHVHLVEGSQAHLETLEGDAHFFGHLLLEFVLAVRGLEVDLFRNGMGARGRREGGVRP